jgi:hypothetical protein
VVVLKDLPHALVIVLTRIRGVSPRFALQGLAKRQVPQRCVRCTVLAGESLFEHVIGEHRDVIVMLLGADVGDQLDPGAGIRDRRGVVVVRDGQTLGASAGGI